MELRQLGDDGPRVPVIGFGAWPIGGGMGDIPEREGIATVHAALDNGITLIDTAQAYRSSETVIGKALVGCDRDDVFLATKVSGRYSRQDILTAVENSLRALKMDVIDLYEIHGWNPQYPIQESMETFAELQAAGKVRHLGVSNFNVDQMRQAMEVARFVSLQPRYSLMAREIEADILPYCEAQGVGILPHSPLAKGLLTGKYRPGHRFPEGDERRGRDSFSDAALRELEPKVERLREIAEGHGKTLVQLAVNALLRQGAVSCVLVGGKNPAQVEEHAGAQGWSLTDAEWAEINGMFPA